MSKSKNNTIEDKHLENRERLLKESLKKAERLIKERKENID